MPAAEKIKIADALLLLQSDVMKAKRTEDGQTGSGQYKYATLDDVWESCREKLAKYDLLVTQVPGMVSPDGEIKEHVLSTTIIHVPSGTTLEGQIPLIGATDMKKMGSAITYARRYSLVTMLGILTGEDDDGTAVSAPAQAKANPTKAAPAGGNGTAAPLSAAQNRKIFAIIGEREVPDDVVEAIRNRIRAKTLSVNDARVAIDKLEQYPVDKMKAAQKEAAANLEENTSKTDPADIPF